MRCDVKHLSASSRCVPIGRRAKAACGPRRLNSASWNWVVLLTCTPRLVASSCSSSSKLSCSSQGLPIEEGICGLLQELTDDGEDEEADVGACVPRQMPLMLGTALVDDVEPDVVPVGAVYGAAVTDVRVALSVGSGAGDADGAAAGTVVDVAGACDGDACVGDVVAATVEGDVGAEGKRTFCGCRRTSMRLVTPSKRMYLPFTSVPQISTSSDPVAVEEALAVGAGADDAEVKGKAGFQVKAARRATAMEVSLPPRCATISSNPVSNRCTALACALAC